MTLARAGRSRIDGTYGAVLSRTFLPHYELILVDCYPGIAA